MSRPRPSQWRTKWVRDCTGTLYFLFQTLVSLSLITESKYHIKMIQNKTTTVVVFTVSIHTVLSPIYIYIYKKLYIYIYIFRARNLLWWTPTSVLAQQCAEDHRHPSLYLHELKPVLSFTLSGKHIAYMYTRA